MNSLSHIVPKKKKIISNVNAKIKNIGIFIITPFDRWKKLKNS